VAKKKFGTMNGLCTCCGEKCVVIVQDFGIGAYEYWGQRGTDVQLKAVSGCCEAEARTMDGEEEITLEDLSEALEPTDAEIDRYEERRCS